jgi:putative restriction endonuclease
MGTTVCDDPADVTYHFDMLDLNDVLSSLSSSHRAALIWFIEHRGQEVSWPAQLPDGTFLVNRPKGIHKPAGWKHTLSVRQMMQGPYADAEPALQEDGSWRYQYFQEGTNPEERDRYFTNVGLMACIEDGVPIGVLRQTSQKPNARYKIMGLAWVLGWRRDGYFLLDGLSPSEETRGLSSERMIDGASFVPSAIEDARTRIVSSIVQRQGQAQFRAKLLRAYGGRCAITGCDASSTLEAAHIVPYQGSATNLEANGLLLRADIHTLFDLGLIAIDGDTMSVILSPTLSSGHYSKLQGRKITLPDDASYRPNAEALAMHRQAARL